MSKTGILTIAVVVAAVAVVLLMRSGGKPGARAVLESNLPPPKPEISVVPDPPVSFGYKQAWLAFRSEDPAAVIQALGLSSVEPANWQSGIGASLRTGTFVSPPVDGWIVAISFELPELGNKDKPGEWQSFILRLAPKFAEIQYFATHRVVEYHAWARVRGGKVERAYAYLGEAGEVLLDEGEPTDAEKSLGHDFRAATLALPESEDIDFDSLPPSPTEEDVMKVAALWGLDPRALSDRELPPSTGWYSPSRPAV